jgi:lipoprotein-anchoring transpeptidase ErfK/SrfK
LLVVLAAVGAIAAGSARATASDACPAAPAAPAAGLTVSYPAAATLVGPANASVAALVDAGGGQAQFVVEYGTSTDYGLCTAAAAVPAGTGAQSLSVLLTGLTPVTTYHFRVVATGASGSTAGADEVLTTLPAGEIPQGVTINGLQVGGLSRKDAVAEVRQLIAGPAKLALGSAHWTVLRSKLGARLDAAGDRYGEPARGPTVGLVGRHAVITRPKPGLALVVWRAAPLVTSYLVGSRSATLRLPSRRLRTPRAGGPKAVVIRLGAQTLTAYRGSKVVVTTPVTTGRPALPTPVGSYTIQARYTPYTFISPWPEGSPYWYPPAPVTWAMPFYDGDFLHDDPGEPDGAYGAGSQYGPYASHGCVHVPHDVMAFLFRWLPVGATVIVADS